MASILFNGKTYSSVNEMPENERQAFEQLSTILVDRNGNGIPDFLEGDLLQNVVGAFTGSLNMNGKTYGSLNELPEDMRARVQGAFEKMAELGMVTKTNSPLVMQVGGVQMGQKPAAVSQPFLAQASNPAIREDRGSKAFVWVLAGMLLCFLLAGAAFAVLYFMR